MTRVRRTIRPIGQGAFYTEQLHTESGDFNIVYDCGLEMLPNPPQRLKTAIDHYIDKIGSDGLNIIFISHFHSDHINGIKYLLNKANKSHPVIVMPLIGEDLGIVYFIENLSEYYVTTNGDNISFDGETISFYQKLLFSNDDRFIRINHEDGAKHIGLNIKSNNCPREEDWLYIPVACIDNDLTGYAQAVLSELQKKYPGIADTLKLGETEAIAKLKWKDIYNIIREVRNKNEFRSVNLNNMSLMLYSGIGRPMNVFENKCCDYLGRCYDYHGFRRCHHYYDGKIFPGALYTGDMEKAEAWDILQTKLFDKYPFAHYLSLFQISHHGHGYGKTASQDNTFNLNAPCFVNARLAFCCYGSQNRYHHPDYRLLKQYFEYDIPSMGIDENTRSLIQIVHL